MPFSLIMQNIDVHSPVLLIDLLCLLRLVKIWPIFKPFSILKRRDVNRGRIMEVIITYYIACHIVTCIVISIALHEPDVRNTWLRRVPVPQGASGTSVRVNPSAYDESPRSIYVHALYFTVNTISHVAIGDITAISVEERLFNAFLILCGTFIYAFLFGNIASIVADFAPNMFIHYHEKYQFTMSRVRNSKVPKHIATSVNNYYDYMWAQNKGFDEEDYINHLPDSLRSDIMLCRYQSAIESSLVFKDKDGQIDVPLTNSLMKVMKLRTRDMIFNGSESTCTRNSLSKLALMERIST